MFPSSVSSKQTSSPLREPPIRSNSESREAREAAEEADGKATDHITPPDQQRELSLKKLNEQLRNNDPPKDLNGRTMSIADFFHSPSLLRSRLDNLLNLLQQKRSNRPLVGQQQSQYSGIKEEYVSLFNQWTALSDTIIETLTPVTSDTPKNCKKLLNEAPPLHHEQSKKTAALIDRLLSLPATKDVKKMARFLLESSMMQMHQMCTLYNETEENQFYQNFLNHYDHIAKAKESNDKRRIDVIRSVLTTQVPAGIQATWEIAKAYHEFNETMKLPYINNIDAIFKKKIETNLDAKHIKEIETINYHLSMQERLERLEEIDKDHYNQDFNEIIYHDDSNISKSYIKSIGDLTLDNASFKAPTFNKSDRIEDNNKKLQPVEISVSGSVARQLSNEINKLEDFSVRSRNGLMLTLWNESGTNRSFREKMHSWANRMNDISGGYKHVQGFAKNQVDDDLFDDQEKSSLDKLAQKLKHREDMYALIGKRTSDYADQFCRPMPTAPESSPWLSEHFKAYPKDTKAKKARVVDRSGLSRIKKINPHPIAVDHVAEANFKERKDETISDLMQRTHSLINQADKVYGSNEHAGSWCEEPNPYLRKMAIETALGRYGNALHNLDKILHIAERASATNQENIDIDEAKEKIDKCLKRKIVLQALLGDKRSEIPTEENTKELISEGMASFGWSDKGAAIIPLRKIHPTTGAVTKTSYQLIEKQINYNPIEVVLESKESISYPIPPSYLHDDLQPDIKIQSIGEVTKDKTAASHIKLENYRRVGKKGAWNLGIRYVPKVDVSKEWSVKMSHAVAKLPNNSGYPELITQS